MVAKITVPITINRALNYNEQKVQKGTAKCIHANGFLKEAEQLNFYDKLNRFEQLISLNKRAATNTVHISLNFAVKENISEEKLTEIASTYMEKIGFGNQPYLVYQHFDAGNPHMHIVTTNIQNNGKRISLHNIGKNQSAKARKEIEIAFKLIKPEDHKKEKSEEITPLDLRRLTYGTSPTKRGITNVLDAVLPKYRYASLAELNAILKLYNLVADSGKEGGIIFKKNGLVYRILDEKGNKIGVPIKASSVYNKPTLSSNLID
ncbi:relaxase/mobilization nuclease domain-containing protein [Ginsengibacter hankyongi]|uniref:Relaxase/mobilization nuclease domain-containing protein n=1 Tax=Ginsengibacter hankyongi TaxID=2607284 RepID=A0A5J5IFV3_9BACT|nr:relaxase/mobilization nuclease domain-containing protein [Ginsengibacter hankyongi]KAA9039064.1 relaxase/mobilization nuclease domain-containing protein [Ginsengibacter hankyongi]